MSVSSRRALSVLALVTAAACGVSASAAATPVAKCRVVHHKKVCTKPKPKPKPVPAPTIAAKIPLDAQIFDIADGFGSIWARVGSDATNGGDTLVRIDPATNAVVARIHVPKGFGVAVGETAVWTTNFTDNTVSRIDPATNAIVATVELADVRPVGITATPGSVWVVTEGADNAPGILYRISSFTNLLDEGTLPGVDGGSDVAFSGGSVWIVGGQELVRASETSLGTTVVREIANQNACGGMASNATTVWIAGGSCGFPKFALAVVTSADGKTVATPSVPTLSDVALGLGAAWAISTNGTLIRLDTSTRKPVSQAPTDAAGSAAVIDAALGGVWVGGADGTLERFAP
ncbi:MAG: virginiamycin lyase [Gaiellaceae bacterium]|nr:virginiamycin lyase [Gaiellaceae bacterium]